MTSTPATTNSTMTKNEEVAFWLHNKLGSHADLWSSFSISSGLTQEHLQSIKSILWTLDTLVKVKLLLSFIHIPKRNITEWETLLKEIIDQCHQDNVGDQWIVVISEIMKTFPDRSLFNVDLSDQECEGFDQSIQELRKTVKKNNDTTHLPLESCYLGRSSLKVLTGEIPNPPKCFSLIRKAKSARIRQDLLDRSAQAFKAKKSAEAAALSNARRTDDEPLSYSSPVVSATRPSNIGFLKSSPITGNTSVITGTPRFNARREGYVKLLSLEEEQALRDRKRKPQPASADDDEHGSGKKSARGKKALAPTTQNEKNNNNNNSGANDSLTNTTNSGKTPPSTRNELSPTVVSPIAYAPSSFNEMPATPNPVMNTTSNDMLFGLQATRHENPFSSPISKPIHNEKVSTPILRPDQKLTEEQLNFVRELFRTSPCLTASDKSRILSFIAGARDCSSDPNQSGPNSVVTIKLSEQHETINDPNTGQLQNYFVESLFQMNTSTGEWKRIKRLRPINVLS